MNSFQPMGKQVMNLSAKYEPAVVESKWQEQWAKENVFRAPNPDEPGFVAGKQKYYILDMFPYPSGSGLHVGHPEGYTATDILARWKRMQGYNVLHPMGWDAFGLPAEQYAVQTGTHPAITTQKNIAAFRGTLQKLGFSYDWSREVNTTAPAYYRWTQWIFLKIFNSIFDTKLNKARLATEIERDLEAGRIGLSGSASLRFDLTAAQARAAGLGKQWDQLSQEERRAVLAAHRLAYVSEIPVWWCEAMGTVLANEEVIGGRSERGDFPCVKKPLRQWMMRITAYAQRLLDDLDGLDWPEPTKLMQRHWVGRSEGAEVDFELAALPGRKLRVFTTRPDTLYGATYMVLAPEHPLVKEITTPEYKAAVERYVQEAGQKSDLARTDLAKEKTGVFTGAYAYNPVYPDRNDPRAKIPLWIADYVLTGYGTGAIMAVPAHDERDAEFALKFKLPVTPVVMPPDEWLKANAKAKAGECELRELFRKEPVAFKETFIADGVAFNSPIFDKLPTPEAKKKIIAWLEEKKLGEGKVTFRLRDWIFSRQRYWGEPFPIVWDEKGQAYAVAEDQLPVVLPEMKDYKPSGTAEPPLSKAQEWVRAAAVPEAGGGARIVKRGTPGAIPVRRETNTMPNWAGSCWYYLRYADPQNSQALCGPAAEKYWLNVDLYVGGSEHAVLHLLYSRFWHKVLFDLGVVHTSEPFQKLFHQGLIQAFVFEDPTGRLVPNDEVEERPDGSFVQKSTGAKLQQLVGKMSKSLKNVIPADDVICEFGADTLRLYEMFMGPLEGSKPWNPRDVPGMFRFLRDCWRMIVLDDESAPEAGQARPALRATAAAGAPTQLDRELHKTIKGVTQDLERLAFNTAISKLMVFKNHALAPGAQLTRSQAERFILLLAPFAPHLAEELWSRLGHTRTLIDEKWPRHEEALAQDLTKEMAVQVNGKLKARITAAANAPENEIKALAQEAVKNELAGKTIVKVVVVPGRLVNFVVK
jgi:leucyl-tRNA synthetase